MDVGTDSLTLGIVDPIVLGASFGGMVALAYATRHPAHPAKLVLISTEAAGDSYLDSDAVFGVKESLIRACDARPVSIALDGRMIDRPYLHLDYNFAVKPEAEANSAA